MPEWKPEIRRRLATLQLAPTREAAIVEELAQDLDDCYAESLSGGAPEDEAYRAALAELSGSELLAQELRRVERQFAPEPIVLGTNRRTNMIAELWQDVRYGMRMLLKNPGFTLIAVLTLALGIGANTAIFSVLYGVLLKPLPYPDPNLIVRVWQAAPASGFARIGFSEAELMRLRAGSQSFQQIGGYTFESTNLSDQNETQRIAFARVTAGVFESLGVQPALGRVFRPEDEAPGGQQVAVLSYEMWQRQYSGDANILGHVFLLDDNPVTVVGVMPPDFRLPEDLSIPQGAELWLPVRIDPANLNRNSHYLLPIARLKPGVRPEQALTEVSTMFTQLRQDHPQGAIKDPGYNIRVLPLHNDLVGNVKKVLWVLVGAVGLVLLIACANVSSLLLARAAGRQKEIAVRAALGAGRGRLIRQLLTESVLIALLGGTVGVTLAGWGVALIAKTNLISVPRLSQITLNLTVLLFTLGICLVAAVLFGLAPAAQVSRLDLNRALGEEGRGLTGSAGGNRIQRVLVVSEVALAVVVVIAAGLLLRSFDRLLRIDPGFNVKNLLTVNINLPASRYQDRPRVTTFYNQLLERVRALPGVVAAAATSGLPLTDASGDTVFQIEGRPSTGVVDRTMPPDRSAYGHVYFWQVMPDYFKTMGVALRQGRVLQASDDANAPPVVVINETMARRFWPNESPLGKRIRLSWSTSQQGPWAEIVGVVRDVPLRQLNEETQPEGYLSPMQGAASWTARGMTLVVRTAADTMALAEAVRREARALDSAVPVFGVRSAEQALSRTVAQPRFNLMLLGLFAVVALLLAAVGIYGVLAHAVRQRTHEMGIRLALGASSGTVFRLVIGQGMGLAGVGIVVGLGGAFALTRYLESLLYEVKPTDPLTFGGVALSLLGVALLACWLPARRATKVDPLAALRQVGMVLVLLCSPALAYQQPETPDTPAGRVLAEWIEAFNSAEPAKLSAYDTKHRRQSRPVPQTLSFREQTGGFNLLRIEKSEALAITVLLQERNSDQIGRMELVVDNEDPPKLVREELLPVPHPPDLAIPRLTEPAAVAALSEYAQRTANNDRFSGIVLVAHKGKVLLEKGWGLAQRERGIPVTPDTQFNIASIYKMFTAVAILQLVESGKLSFDDAVGKHLPDYANKDVASKVTIRHLLTHTGGTGDIFGSQFTSNRLTLREHEDYVKLYESRALLFEPGSQYRYSNYGFILLGRIIERVSGVSYDDYLRSKIFVPAGMKSTDARPENEVVPNRAAGYRRQNGAWVSNSNSLPWRGMAFGVGYSTARDLLRFAQALESGKLISKSMLAKAITPQREQTGYGFAVGGEGRLRYYGHPGGMPGAHGDVRIFPQLKYVLISLSNLDPPVAQRIIDHFMNRMPIQ